MTKNVLTSIATLIFANGLSYGLDMADDFVNEDILIESSGNGAFSSAGDLNIINKGTISGSGRGLSSGNGILAQGNSSITNIINYGLIKGNTPDSPGTGGHGIAIVNPAAAIEIQKIINTGVISGNGVVYDFVANGLSFASFGAFPLTVNEVNNSGSITGTLADSTIQSWSGNGISYDARNTTIGSLTNSGIIQGKVSPRPTITSDVQKHFANGIVFTGTAHINSIANSGLIAGIVTDGKSRNIFDAGNGIALFSSGSIADLQNKGIISGFANLDLTTMGSTLGNGLSLYSESSSNTATLDNINNTGVISGYSSLGNITTTSGNGILVRNINGQASLDRIHNSGVIKGSNAAIMVESKNDTAINSFINNGILAGQKIVMIKVNGIDQPFIGTNNGIYITLDSTNPSIIESIEIGSGGEVTLADGSIKEVLNGVLDHTGLDSYLITNNQTSTDLIINGAGINKGALIVQGNSSLNDCIVNGYITAAYIEDGASLTATNTTFNGGGLENNVAVIKGDDGANIAEIVGSSIINGAVDLGDGNDQLTLANSVQINGMLSGGAGSDLLNLGQQSSTETLQILHDINGFETINTNGKVTLFETVKVSGADSINIESGELVLRVDPSKLLDGKVIGHALYENNGTLTSNGGKLVIGLNGLSEGAIISMGGTTIAPDTNDSWWKDTDRLITSNSLVLDAKLSQDGNDVHITILEDIPELNMDSLLYEKLNDVYQSIVGAGEIGNLANTTLLEDKTTEESLGALLVILDQMYANNPYSYTLKSTRDSIKLFEDHLTYLTIKPKAGELITQGKFLYSGVKNDNSAVGKNYYGFDTGHRNYKTTTNTEGALTSIEYGLSDLTSIGLVLGANHQDINFKGLSRIDANSLYTGTFAKTQVNNFQFIAGLGYQYTNANAKRRVTNGYDSFSTSDQYNINSFNTFIESKYIYLAEENWSIEPKFRVSYYMINQGNVNEGYTPEQISMRADKAKSNTVDLSLGVDFVKTVQFSQGRLKNIVSAEVINTLGERNKALNGYIIGKNVEGKRFDIQGVKLPSTSGKLGYTLEFEANQGMIYAAGISLEFAKDSNTNLNVSCGIGYKF